MQLTRLRRLANT